MRARFKTAWFTKAARKARIHDSELCVVVNEIGRGLAVDLGGGVFKKRLDKNEHRAIILAKVGRYFVFEYLFAKKDRANIDDGQLRRFRLLAKAYGRLTDTQLTALVDANDLVEICNGREAQIQK